MKCARAPLSNRLFFLVASCLYPFLAFGETVETFYGSIEVEEPVILELIKSPAIQRLKHIHQYGVAYYTTHTEDYNRFDHSLGVFAILKKNNATLEEQIVGLLHDVSHTVFSHVGDWLFGKEYQEEDYQTTIYKIYLSHSGIEDILVKHGFILNNLQPKCKKFIKLEQSLPNLCADRIDYNIQGAYYQKFLTKEEAIELYNDLRFVDGRWVGTRIDLLKKLARFTLFMTQDCWGAADNYAASRWLADAMLKGLAMGLITWNEIHFGVDQDIWNKLLNSQDEYIQKRMHMVLHATQYFKWVDPADADVLVKFRCRGIDPWVLHKGQIIRLSIIDADLAHEIDVVKKRANEGWPIKLLDAPTPNYFDSWLATP